MKKLNLFFTGIVAMACVVSCQLEGGDVTPPDDDDAIANERRDIPLTEAEEALVDAGNVFAFDLLRSVAAADAGSDHVFLSPLSAGLAFGMLSNGAAGVTFDEISRTFGFDGASAEVINDYYLKMLTELKAADRDVALESANSIWIRDGFPVLDAFVKVNEEKYGADVRNEDFADPATLALINAWCADKTHGKIKSILDELNPAAAMCLLNALYFKGAWSIPFDKALTKEAATFFNEDGSTTPVAMMHRDLTANYVKGPGFELAELPYGVEAFSMILLLPDEGSAAQSVAASLDAAVWNDCLAKASQREVKVALPRMNLEYEITLNGVLAAMGMPAMFDPDKADFSRINPDAGLFISLVKQKTTLEINEEGSEAAAVTVVGMLTSPGEIAPPVSLTFDRPFLFFIKEKSTGLILFAGFTKKL
jgi:serpin B